MRLGILISVLAAGAGEAQDRGELPPLPEIDCYCTDRTGDRVELGETICLNVDGRAFLARCEMSLNNPMWRDTGSDCIGAALRRFEPVRTMLPGGA